MALKSSGTLYLQGSDSRNGIAFHFTGVAPHKLSEYYGAGFGVPSSGTLKFSDFYGEEYIIPNNSFRTLVAEKSPVTSAVGEGNWRHFASIAGNVSVRAFKCDYSFNFRWTKQYRLIVGKNRNNTSSGFATHYHNKHAGHSRYTSASGNFTINNARFRSGDRLDFNIYMWGGYGRDQVTGGNIKVYV